MRWAFVQFPISPLEWLLKYIDALPEDGNFAGFQTTPLPKLLLLSPDAGFHIICRSAICLQMLKGGVSMRLFNIRSRQGKLAISVLSIGFALVGLPAARRAQRSGG